MIFNKSWHVWHTRGEAHRDTCVSVEGPTINTAHAAPSEATVSIGAKAVAYCDLIATKAKIIHITHTDLKVMLDRDTNGYAVKPATLIELKEVFARLESKLAQKVKRVLLVEDDARQRESVVRLISDDDVEISAVESGENALVLLRREAFDCMIIDLARARHDGQRLAQTHVYGGFAIFAAGDCLHRAISHPERGSRITPLLPDDYHQRSTRS